jgi:hypothetical protein
MKIDGSKLLVWAAILIAVVMAVAQEATKEWTIKTTGTPDILQFTVRRFRPGNTWSSSRSVPRSRFQGLSIDTLEHGGAAKFSYVQDAGRLDCQGRFSWNGGSGNYTFVPNPDFSAELRKLGYIPPDHDQQFTMLIVGVNLDFARTVKESGLRSSTDQLIELREHGVTGEYITETRNAGYKDLLAQDFIELRDHGVKTDFLRDLKDYGYKFDARDAIQLRDHGVQSAFLHDLKEAGYDLSAREVTDLRDHGVSSEEMRELRRYGLRPPATGLIELRDHGVTPEYLKGMKDAGYDRLTPREVVQLRDHGVDTAFAQDSHDLGYNFSADELVRLRDHGVDGHYLKKLRESGIRTLSAEQIEKLRTHGIE